MFKSGNLDTLNVEFEVGYWRKANAIHSWFVTNCQDGKDECRASSVSRDQMKELREICNKVIKILSEQKRQKTMVKDKFSGKDYEHELYLDTDEIMELLPPIDGFFFGGKEIDECYVSNLEETIKIVDKCLELPEEWDFEYCSSW